MDAENERVQVVPMVYYYGNTRVVIGTATVTGDKIEYEIDEGLAPEVKDLLRDSPTSFSAAEVLHKDTPLFPANAYQVNEPLASARLIDAILGIKEIKEEGEAD